MVVQFRESDQSDGQSSQPRQRREVRPPLVEPPHICTKKEKELQTNFTISRCLVYTKEMRTLSVDAILHSATNQENDTNSAEWCRYPIGKVPFDSYTQRLMTVGEKGKGRLISSNLWEIYS